MILATKTKLPKKELDALQELSAQFFLINNCSLEELVDLAAENNNSNQLGLDCKQELIDRGKDDIKIRIEIKKYCKTVIARLELEIAKTNKENKKATSQIKNKFLTIVSLLDKLQLEWQKYDIRLNTK